MSLTPHKIIVRAVNWLGDAVMTTPALLRLRERFPSAEITLLTPEKLGPLYLHHPAVNRVLMFSPNESLVTIATWLRDERFDLGIVFPNSPRSALELWLGGVRTRVGYRRPWRSWMLSQAVMERTDLPRMRKRTEKEIRQRIAANVGRETYDSAGHHAHDYLRLVAAVGCNPAPLPPLLRVEESEARAFATRCELPHGHRIFGLNAGAEYGPAKRWPEKRFAAAAAAIHRQTGCLWLLLGGAGDVELSRRIAAEVGAEIGMEQVHNIAGQTSLRELCAALRCCSLLLTNDTGPMHVAAALGTNVVVPFGSTSPELTGPGLPGDDRNLLLLGQAACAPCFLRECPVDFRCMQSISVDQVTAAVLRAAPV